MATAKKTTKKPATRKKSTADAVKKEDDAGFACVLGELLWRYRAISAEWNEAQALLREVLLQEEKEYAKEVYAPLRKLRSQIKHMQLENSGKTAELTQVQAAIAERFNLPDLKNCAIDSTTGRIYLLDDEGTGVQKPATLRTLNAKHKKPTSRKTKKTAVHKTKKT